MKSHASGVWLDGPAEAGSVQQKSLSCVSRKAAVPSERWGERAL